MTAANVFARDGGAWMFFDTAVYDDDGFVRRFSTKVVASDDLRLAIGICGRPPPNWLPNLQAWLGNQLSQAHALIALPSLLSDMSAQVVSGDNRARWWERLFWKSRPPINEPGIRLLVAWWDADKGGGAAGVITDVDDLGPKYPPHVLHSVRTLTSPRPEFGEWFDFDDDLGAGYDFDPMRDGATLGELERRQPNDSGGYRVGGSFERIHIHAGGIDRATIIEWPDRIGRPIKVME